MLQIWVAAYVLMDLAPVLTVVQKCVVAIEIEIRDKIETMVLAVVLVCSLKYDRRVELKVTSPLVVSQ